MIEKQLFQSKIDQKYHCRTKPTIKKTHPDQLLMFISDDMKEDEAWIGRIKHKLGIRPRLLILHCGGSRDYTNSLFTSNANYLHSRHV